MNSAGVTGHGGVYRIVHVPSGRFYVGSAVHLRRRCVKHLGELRSGRHHNLPLQLAWQKYGAESFRFEVLAVLERTEVRSTEQRLLDRSVGTPGCYNIGAVADAPVVLGERTAEHRAALSTALRGRKKSPEHAVSIAEAARERGASPQFLASRRNAGRKHTGETLDRMRAAQTGRTYGAETKAKVGCASKSRWADPEWRAKTLAAQAEGRRRKVEQASHTTPTGKV